MDVGTSDPDASAPSIPIPAAACGISTTIEVPMPRDSAKKSVRMRIIDDHSWGWVGAVLAPLNTPVPTMTHDHLRARSLLDPRCDLLAGLPAGLLRCAAAPRGPRRRGLRRGRRGERRPPPGPAHRLARPPRLPRRERAAAESALRLGLPRLRHPRAPPGRSAARRRGGLRRPGRGLP